MTKNKILASDVRMYTPEAEPGWIKLSFDILAEYTCLQHAEMAQKSYSPVYSPGQTAKNPKKFYDKASNCRIAFPPLLVRARVF